MRWHLFLSHLVLRQGPGGRQAAADGAAQLLVFLDVDDLDNIGGSGVRRPVGRRDALLARLFQIEGVQRELSATVNMASPSASCTTRSARSVPLKR